MLIYNGDADPGLNSLVGENWTVGLGFNESQASRGTPLQCIALCVP